MAVEEKSSASDITRDVLNGSITSQFGPCLGERTADIIGTSQLWQTRTSCASFDYLVSAGEQCRRHGKAEPLGRLQIDCQIKFGRHLDRQIGWSGATQNSICVASKGPIELTHIWPVCHQQPLLGERRPAGDGGQL